MVDILTGEVEDREPTPEEQGKDKAAVALGRKGGLKGGKARNGVVAPMDFIEGRDAGAKGGAIPVLTGYCAA
jgi:hypothetical protein